VKRREPSIFFGEKVTLLENVLTVKFYRKGEPLSEKERISDSVCEKISLSFSLFSPFLSN
jgi:hypothetical protein